MPPAVKSQVIACGGGPLSGIDADLLVVPWFEDESATGAPEVSGIDSATGGEIARAVAAQEFQPKPYEWFMTPVTDRQWRGRRIALIGAGRRADCGSDLVRKLTHVAWHSWSAAKEPLQRWRRPLPRG